MTSINTRVSKALSSLIERKMGSSLNEGGTWIDPLMALNLAQHLSGKFALEATHILVNYFTQQGSTRKLNIQSF